MSSHPLIKICGITNHEDALMCANEGADYLGFIFARSPRSISVESAAQIVGKLPKSVTPVAVFVNENPSVINQTLNATGIRFAQLHGNESPEMASQVKAEIIKTFENLTKLSLERAARYKVFAFLVDMPKEETKQQKEQAAAKAEAEKRNPPKKPKYFKPQKEEIPKVEFVNEISKLGKVFLSGNLTDKNVAELIAQTKPFAVDVARFTELIPGKKDPAKVRAFVQAVKGA